MSDEGRIHSTLAIELLLKGKNHQGLVNVFAKKLDASLTPRPELRAHVVDDRDAALLHLARDPPVECGRVDHDRKIGTAAVGFGDQVMERCVNLGKMAKDLGDADDREVFGVDDRVTSGGAHALTAHAEEFKRRVLTAQRLDQLRAIHFSRSLAGGDEDAHRGIVMATRLLVLLSF